MKPLLILRDEDIFLGSQSLDGAEYVTRVAVKVIVFDAENKIALAGTRYRLFPGGGVEEGESLIEAVLREYREEVGGTIEVEKEIAWTEEYRARIGRRQETHYFIAKIVGDKGSPETTQHDEQGIETEWLSLEGATLLLEKQVNEIPFESYNACFNVRTHLAVLTLLKNMLN